MNITLINPRTDDMITTEVPGYISKEVGRFPPMGLLYLAAYVRHNSDHTVDLVDMPARDLSYDQLATMLKDNQPDLVGITGTTHNLVEIKRTAEQVKTVLPDCPVVLGGPHVDAFPAESSAMAAIDYTIRGEGEIPFLLLVNALAASQVPAAAPGLGFCRDGKAVVPDPSEPIADLDSLPFPARDLIESRDYYYVLGKRATFTTMITTRGCPFRCIFCSTPHGRHRARSAGNVVDEMETCLAQGSEEFHFVDDTFNVQQGRLAAVSREILERKLTTRWSVRVRADNLTEEDVRLARQAGCIRIHLGVETSSNHGMEVLRKGITTEQVERVLSWTRKYRITSAAYFLIGCPHETTRDAVLDTIAFACRTDPDFALFNILTIYPHTELHEMAVKQGLIGPADWSAFARDPDPGFKMRFWEASLSRDELVELLQVAYRRFYLRPAPIWRNLRSLSSLEDLRHKLAAGLGILFGKR